MKFVPPETTAGIRMMVCSAATQGWYQAPEEEKEQVLPHLVDLYRSWVGMGAELVASFDDDFLQVGQPGTAPYSIYAIYDVPSLEIAVAMVGAVRDGRGGLRIDRYFRFEARLGRPLFFLDR